MRKDLPLGWIVLAAAGVALCASAASAQPKSAPRGFRDSRASAQIAAEIRDALQLRKTLVVWLVETTRDSSELARAVPVEIDRIFESAPADAKDRLQMAIATYGTEVKLLTPAALSDPEALRRAASPLRVAARTLESSPGPRVLAALNEAIEKFLPHRSQGYEVIFVVVGANSGGDIDLADKAIIALRRAAAPMFGVGPAIPFGVPAAPGRGKAKSPPPPATAEVRRFESLYPERIQLALSGGQSTADLNDSGFGPFGLERVCRQTGGKFFRQVDGTPRGWTADPSAGDIDAALRAKYAPDYVNQQEYQSLLHENKCRLALHNAAQLPPTTGLESPRIEFPREANEARMAQNLRNAQQQAAEKDQPLQRLYDALMAGEEDRPNLTGPRWQAGYDLAMGQVLAAKARLDGYNALLATLKQGKNFDNPDSRRWVLEPADEIAAGSALDKMAKSSRAYLQRVVDEHQGTPWAAIAQRELRHPAGWRLVER